MMKRTKRLLSHLAAVLVLALLTACGGQGAAPAPATPKVDPPKADAPKPAAPAAEVKLTKPVTLAIATGPQGGGWYNYGASFAELMKKNAPAGSTFDILPKALGIGNVKLLQSKQADIGLIFTVTAAWAENGTDAFTEKQSNVKGLVGGFDTYYCGTMISNKSGINTLKDVKEKKIGIKLVTQNMGSQSEWCTRQVLQFYGLTYDLIKSWGGNLTATDYTTIGQLAKDGKADVMITVLTPGHPTFTEISLAGNYTFKPLPDDLIKYMVEKHGFSAGTMPAKTFPNQNEPVKLVKTQTTLAARADLPEDVAYFVTKNVVEGLPSLAGTYKATAIFKPENACKPELNNITLHPGAIKYYKEKGCLK
jgi:TRAP transporter TAXI family solute receptor